MFNFLKLNFAKTFIDLENPKIFKTIISSFLITLIFAITMFVFFYYVLFNSFFNLAELSQLKEGGVIKYLLSLKIFTYLVGIIQFFTSWILISLILVPVGTIISGLFAENIFFSINNIHNYKWKYHLKKNAFVLSIKYSLLCGVRSMLINILILPLYLILPFANILIFIIINAFLVGRDFSGNFLIQFFDNQVQKKIFILNQNKMYFIGLFIVFLYTIPILNLIAPIIGSIMTSHLLLSNQSTIKKLV